MPEPTVGNSTVSLKRLVADGYDRIAQDTRWRARWSASPKEPPPHRAYLEAFLRSLPRNPRVLDVGCGDGGSYLPWLSERATVVGLDVSRGQLHAAAQRTPSVQLLQADMGSLPLAPTSFNGLVALYSIIHVPRWEHAALFESIRALLRRNGMLLAVLGAGDTPGGWEDDWFGSRMYWSHHSAPEGQRLLRQAGFAILESQIEPDYLDPQAAHLFVLARREG